MISVGACVRPTSLPVSPGTDDTRTHYEDPWYFGMGRPYGTVCLPGSGHHQADRRRSWQASPPKATRHLETASAEYYTVAGSKSSPATLLHRRCTSGFVPRLHVPVAQKQTWHEAILQLVGCLQQRN